MDMRLEPGNLPARPPMLLNVFQIWVQAIKDRMDIYSEHKGAGLYHVLRRDLSNSRSVAFLGVIWG